MGSASSNTSSLSTSSARSERQSLIPLVLLLGTSCTGKSTIRLQLERYQREVIEPVATAANSKSKGTNNTVTRSTSNGKCNGNGTYVTANIACERDKAMNSWIDVFDWRLTDRDNIYNRVIESIIRYTTLTWPHSEAWRTAIVTRHELGTCRPSLWCYRCCDETQHKRWMAMRDNDKSAKRPLYTDEEDRIRSWSLIYHDRNDDQVLFDEANAFRLVPYHIMTPSLPLPYLSTEASSSMPVSVPAPAPATEEPRLSSILAFHDMADGSNESRRWYILQVYSVIMHAIGIICPTWFTDLPLYASAPEPKSSDAIAAAAAAATSTLSYSVNYTRRRKQLILYGITVSR
jgi:hypothetical protein